MDYGNILSRAWNIVWSNKWMFILGFLAALGSGGSSGGGGGGGRNFSTPAPEDFGSQFPGNFAQMMSEMMPFIIALGCFFVILGIVLWLVRLVGEAGLIASVNRIEAGEKLSFRDGFSAGTSYLPSMVGLSLLLFAPFLLVGLIFAATGISVAVSSFSGGEELALRSLGGVAFCLVPLACLLSIAGLVVSFIYPMAQRSMIIEGLGVMDGLRRGWQVLRENIVEIILLGLIFLVIGIMVGIVSVIVAAPLALLFAVPAIMTAVEGSMAFTISSIILGVAGVIVFILLVAAITSVVRAFQSAAFTLGYHHWTGKGAMPLSDF